MEWMDRIVLIIMYIIIISQVAFGAYLSCEDSDSGSVYNIQGTVSYGFKEQLQTASDYCDEGNVGKEVLSCSGGDCFIVEYSCTGSEGNWEVKTETKKCVDLGYTGCINGACNGTPIPEESCSDNIENQDETDVDCGGSCPACENGDNCNEDSDCESSYCNPNNICATPSCDDNTQNRDEEGIDCGGAYCDSCTETISDFKLLRYIILWAQGNLDPNPTLNNQRILEIIEVWKRP